MCTLTVWPKRKYKMLKMMFNAYIPDLAASLLSIQCNFLHLSIRSLFTYRSKSLPPHPTLFGFGAGSELHFFFQLQYIHILIKSILEFSNMQVNITGGNTGTPIQ